jgi:hypothetical protein
LVERARAQVEDVPSGTATWPGFEYHGGSVPNAATLLGSAIALCASAGVTFERLPCIADGRCV